MSRSTFRGTRPELERYGVVWPEAHPETGDPFVLCTEHVQDTNDRNYGLGMVERGHTTITARFSTEDGSEAYGAFNEGSRAWMWLETTHGQVFRDPRIPSPRDVNPAEYAAAIRARMTEWEDAGLFVGQREQFRQLVCDRLQGHGYGRQYVVLGECTPGQLRAHVLAFVPRGALDTIEREIEEHISMALVAVISATDTGVTYAVPAAMRDLALIDYACDRASDATEVLADWCEEQDDLVRATRLRAGGLGYSIARAALLAAP